MRKKKLKTIGDEVVKEKKKAGNCEITRARLVYTERSGTEQSGTERRDETQVCTFWAYRRFAWRLVIM